MSRRVGGVGFAAVGQATRAVAVVGVAGGRAARTHRASRCRVGVLRGAVAAHGAAAATVLGIRGDVDFTAVPRAAVAVPKGAAAAVDYAVTRVAPGGAVCDRAILTAAAAMRGAGVDVRLTAVGVTQRAVVEAGGAFVDLTDAVHAGRGGVVRHADVAAAVAVIGVDPQVHLATIAVRSVVGLAVAVTEAGRAHRLAAGVVLAVGRTAARRRALLVALAAVVDVAADVFFAAVVAIVVAVVEALAARDLACARLAERLTVEHRAHLVASPAVELVLGQIHLTAILRHAVAIGIARLAAFGLNTAFACAALGGRVRQVTGVAAAAAIHHVDADVDLARIAVLLVAVGEAVRAFGAADVPGALQTQAVVTGHARLVHGAARAVAATVLARLLAVLHLIVAGGRQALGVEADAALTVGLHGAALTGDAGLAAATTAIHVGFGAVLHRVQAALGQAGTLMTQTVSAVGHVGAMLPGAARGAATSTIEVRFAQIRVEEPVDAVVDDDAAVPADGGTRIAREIELGHAARRDRKRGERGADADDAQQAGQARSKVQGHGRTYHRRCGASPPIGVERDSDPLVQIDT